MKRRCAAALLGLVVLTAACSNKPYTSDAAVRDLEEQSGLTRGQAECVVNSIRYHYKVLIAARQEQLGGSPLPLDRLRLEVNNALGTITDPSPSAELATRRAIAKCAPNALR